jgi:hypothetical protein
MRLELLYNFNNLLFLSHFLKKKKKTNNLIYLLHVGSKYLMESRNILHVHLFSKLTIGYIDLTCRTYNETYSRLQT